MQFSKLFDDDRAVSPVIGVILMVAITVILAAVIGTFVLGLGDQVQNDTPRASFSFEKVNDTAATVTHESGDSIDGSNLNISATSNFNASGTTEVQSLSWSDAGGGDTASAGASVTFNMSSTTLDGETVRVVYDNPDNDKTATLSKKEY